MGAATDEASTTDTLGAGVAGVEFRARPDRIGRVIPMLFKSGFWSTAREAQADRSMLLGVTFLLIMSGAWSLDAWLARRKTARRANATADP
jgi:hypothetical protein